MKTIRLYQNTPFTEGKTAELDSDNSHHLNKVLRFPVGKNITVFNGDGFDYTALVQDAKKTTSLKVISKARNNTESKLSIGIKAIRFNMKRRNGKSAMKKLNAILPALEDKAPFTIPERYISDKS